MNVFNSPNLEEALRFLTSAPTNNNHQSIMNSLYQTSRGAGPVVVPGPPKVLVSGPSKVIVPEAIEKIDDEDFEETMGTDNFHDYRPLKLNIGLPHPDPLVQSSSMAAVEPPEVIYKLLLPDKVNNFMYYVCSSVNCDINSLS